MNIVHRSDFRVALKERNLLNIGVDLGVAEGRTAIEMIDWGFSKVLAIDKWFEQENVYETFLAHAEEPIADGRMVVIREWSTTGSTCVADESLDFIHIDAAHDYESVKQDLELWYPKIRMGVGAVCSGHDYSNPAYGVKQAVDEFVAVFNLNLHILPGGCEVDATFWFEKE